MSVSGLTAVRGGRTLFADLSFGLTDADRLAVVGPNGVGKSTLLDLLVGRQTPDAGEVVATRGARIAHLPQTPGDPAGRRALDAVLQAPGVREHEALAALDRLDLDPAAPLSTLSPGQRRRAALARTLVAPSDLLVLDEPTNHLDVDTIDWLEDRLRSRGGGLVLVTHDRYVLERLTTRTLELEDGRVHWHDGGYSVVLEARAERAARRAADARRHRNRLRKEVAWLRRAPKARTSRPKFRLEQARARLAVGDDGAPLALDLGVGRRRLGTHVVDLEQVTVRRGGRTVLEAVDLSIGPGDRIGVVGRNGAGKSTLLEVIAGRRAVDAGRVRTGVTVEAAMYAQRPVTPTGDETVMASITAIAPHVPLANGEVLPASRLAERFGFDDRLRHTRVADLSGGERRRLELLHTLVRAPNLLVLDEPTNDLDLDTLGILEDHLDGFRGTLVVASHDRFLLDRLTDEVLAVQDGRVDRHLDWRAYAEARRVRATPAGGGDAAARPGRGGPAGDDAAGGGGGGPTDSAAQNRARQERRRRLRAVEAAIERLDEAHAGLLDALAQAADDYEAAARLDARRREVEAERSRLEDEWLDLAERV